MINDIQRYRVTTFQIAGFALMSPLGNLVIKLFEIDFSKNLSSIMIFTPIYTLFFLTGIIFVVKGIGILEGKE